MRRKFNRISLAFGGGLLTLLITAAPLNAADTASPDDAPTFNHDIRPILSENCFACHGPDADEGKGDLRLDSFDRATGTENRDEPAIVPGDPEASLLIQRINATDERRIMPPPDSHKTLNDSQKQTLRRWIAAGAEYEKHWAFVPPPDEVTLPQIDQQDWPRNPIDHFILARLEQEGISPAPEADRPTLIRRLSLDLTGLPPTPEQVEQFVNDDSPAAYEKLVDRLLHSPHYGERMAMPWLDAARYADTNGFSIDDHRDMWAWRDWVIHAFNTNKPFDEFAVEQLAGDLLPNATAQQKLASGFNRNHMITHEGGIIPEEYRTTYVADRVKTTSEVFLGLTVACAQCHDHKYDPISQEEYYNFFAYFNSVDESGMGARRGGNSKPRMDVVSILDRPRAEALRGDIADLAHRLTADNAELDAQQAEWEQQLRDEGAAPPAIEILEIRSENGTSFDRLHDGSFRAGGNRPATDTYTITARVHRPVRKLQLSALADDALPGGGPGRSGNGNFVLSAFDVTAEGEEANAIPLAAAEANFSQDNYNIASLLPDVDGGGWAVHPRFGEDHHATFTFANPLPTGRVTITLPQQHGNHLTLGRFRLTPAGDAAPAGDLPGHLAAAVAKPAERRSPEEAAAVRRRFRSTVTALDPMREELAQKREQLDDLQTSVMVMRDLPEPRETFILSAGQYNQPIGEPVGVGTPDALPPLPDDAPPNRLGLARWLTDPDHPLLSRVTVNRYWQMLFGTGIVSTPADFGSQGALPSHPALLDWLAREYVDSGWDTRAMIRLIVTSATYRQRSHTRSDIQQQDPNNRLLARQNRQRLDAELVRDNALAISGLLVPKIGGPSVKPYQPEHLWREISHFGYEPPFTAQNFKQDHGEKLFRRGMYTFIKRTSPPPNLSAFDAPNREVCTVSRATTNTPLQALVLMNDPQFVEAARAFAERVIHEAGPTAADRIGRAFMLAVAREPTDRELAILTNRYEQQADRFADDAAAAKDLLSVGESPRDADIPPAEHAAWTTVMSVILNLDQVITKE